MLGPAGRSYFDVENVMKSLTINRVDWRELSNTDLVRFAQQKNEQALNELLRRHKKTIINKLYRLAPDWKDTSDLEQEVQIRIWRFIGQLRNPDSFRTWLNQLVVNVFYDELRKRPRDYQIISLDEPFSGETPEESGTRDVKDSSQQPDDKLLSEELSQVLEKAMSKISKPFRTVAVLRDVEGLSYEEIAQLTGTELGTVKSRIARARMKIQKQILPYLREAAA